MGRTGKPGVLQPMGLQRVGHKLGTEQQQQILISQPIPSLGRWGGGPGRVRDRPKVTQQGRSRGGTSAQTRLPVQGFQHLPSPMAQTISQYQKSCIPQRNLETPSSPLLGNHQRLVQSSAVRYGSRVYLLCSLLCPSTWVRALSTARIQCKLADQLKAQWR